MDNLDHYKGREQAYFKHRLLEAYLERLFMIVGQYQPTICYVDCFAGPWQEQGPNFEDTSIGISLNIIEKCQNGLHRIGKDVRFRALFVEQNDRSYCKLKEYLETREKKGVDSQARKGSFHELRGEILSWCEADSFVFFFIDHTGWKNAVEIPTLEPLLRRPNSEFLITFMYDFLSRTVPQPDFQDDIRRIFGVVPDTQGMTPVERETYLVSLYRKNLKRVSPTGGGQPRSVCVKVLKPTKDRTLYHLIYLSRHPKGIVEFMEASEKLELVQKKVRALAKQDERVQRSKQFEIFPADESVGEDRADPDLVEVKDYWLTRLSSEPKRFDIRELADMLEGTEWFPGDFQKALRELVNEGKARNLDARRARPVNTVNFEKGETLVRVQP
jgi:three-Cys-motif partner protein